MTKRPWFESAGGRKYSLAVGTLVFAFILALKGKLTAEFSAIAVTVNMAYSAANAFVTGKGTERNPDGK